MDDSNDRYRELYRTYGPAIYRRARSILRDDDLAKDVLQETFHKVIKKRVSFEEASPMTWFYRVVTNHCLNLLRDEKRRQNIRAQHLAEEIARPDPETESQIAALEILAKAPKKLAQIAYHYYFDGMNHEEIANVVGVSRRTIGNRLEEFRAYAQEVLCES